MRKVEILLASLFLLLVAVEVEAGWRMRGGCSRPCINYVYCPPVTYVDCAVVPRCELITGPMKDLRVILKTEYVPEKRGECYTEYRDEERKRVVKVCKTVPVEEERISTELVWIETQETKTIQYTELVPVKTEKTKEFDVKVPVWITVDEPYTVKVPVLTEVEEEYFVKVPVLKDVGFEYTVDVPVRVAEKVSRTVHGVVPVVRAKTVTECIPVATHQIVEHDYGHWESRFVEVPSTRYVWRHGRRYCQTTCQTVCQRVWVPHIVQEETDTVVNQHHSYETNYIDFEHNSQQVEYECVAVCYKPETRSGTKKVVVYENQPRTRTKTVAKYVDEPRTRKKPVLSFETVKKSVTYPVVTYQEVPKSKEVTYTVKVPESRIHRSTVTSLHTVQEDKIETYTVRVPVPMVRETTVQVAQLVPGVVSTTVNPCCNTGYGVIQGQVMLGGATQK